MAKAKTKPAAKAKAKTAKAKTPSTMAARQAALLLENAADLTRAAAIVRAESGDEKTETEIRLKQLARHLVKRAKAKRGEE